MHSWISCDSAYYNVGYIKRGNLLTHHNLWGKIHERRSMIFNLEILVLTWDCMLQLIEYKFGLPLPLNIFPFFKMPLRTWPHQEEAQKQTHSQYVKS
jgi:hypothetical protein